MDLVRLKAFTYVKVKFLIFKCEIFTRLQRSSVSVTYQNGKKTETRIFQNNGQLVEEIYEDDLLKTRIMNGVPQELKPSTGFTALENDKL
jgi:thymidine kinase